MIVEAHDQTHAAEFNALNETVTANGTAITLTEDSGSYTGSVTISADTAIVVTATAA